jgi:hypothetical protein
MSGAPKNWAQSKQNRHSTDALSGRSRDMRNRKFADSSLEGDGFELPVREHRDCRMRTHLVVNHRVAVHVPVPIYRLRPGGANNSKLGLLLGSDIADGKCYDLGFADYRHGLEKLR